VPKSESDDTIMGRSSATPWKGVAALLRAKPSLLLPRSGALMRRFGLTIVAIGLLGVCAKGQQTWTKPKPPSSAPPQAQAVGYNMLTHGPDVTLGRNWFAIPGLATLNLVQNADGSVTDYGVTDADDWHYNDHFGTDHPGPNNTFAGVAFNGGGYFEIVMSIANPIRGWCDPSKDPTCKGWPAWWGNGIHGAFSDVPEISNGQNIEYDAAEFLLASNRAYSAGLIHWHAGQTYTEQNAGYGTSNVTLPAANKFAAKHKYGWLWVPATATTKGYIKNYFDDALVGNTYTWDRYGGGSEPNGSGCSFGSIIDIQHHRLMLGTGPENPMTVYSVTVWQKDDSKNKRIGVPLPTG